MNTRSPTRLAAIRICGLFLLLLAAAVALQAWRGAYTSGFGTHPDEPAHYVTGLLVRDYLAAGALQHPLAFAENYYVHYPRVALGQWPPGFYAIQAGWTLLFGVSRTSVITLMAALSALVALTLFLALRRRCEFPIALSAALIFLSVPLVQEYSGAVMTEVPLALFCLLAALAFGRFLDTGQAFFCILFGVLAIGAILVKGDGLALAFVPAFGIAFCRRWTLLTRPVIWGTGAVIGAVTAPWYFATLDRVSDTWIGTSGTILDYAFDALPVYLGTLTGEVGWIISFLVLAGIIASMRGGDAPSGMVAASLGLVLGTLTIHGVIPSATEYRHIIMAVAPLLLLAAIGLQATLAMLLRWVPPVRVANVAVVAGAIVLVALNIQDPPAKAWRGFEEVARKLVEDPALEGRAIMVASDATVDGILIAEIAMADTRPGRIVLRANRIVSQSDWLGRNYGLRHTEPDEILEVLASAPVAVVLADTSVPKADRRPHHELLRQAVQKDDVNWGLVHAADVTRRGMRFEGALEVYRHRGEVAAASVSFDQVFGASPRPLAGSGGN